MCASSGITPSYSGLCETRTLSSAGNAGGKQSRAEKDDIALYDKSRAETFGKIVPGGIAKSDRILCERMMVCSEGRSERTPRAERDVKVL